MFVRCAYFTGHAVAGKKDQFEAELKASLPFYMAIPKIIAVSLFLAQVFEEGAPDVCAMIQLEFESAADWAAVLDAPARHALRKRFADVVIPLFEGSVKHIDHERTVLRNSQHAAVAPA